MIKSYGLHWQADNVFWGRRNVRGTLMGAASMSSRARQVDFRDQRGIYALYADYDLVYIGQAGSRENHRLFNRLKMHRSDHLSDRWNRFSWFGTQSVKVKGDLSMEAAQLHLEMVGALNVMEAIAIAIAEPRLNLQRGRWSDATQYFQAIDPEIARPRPQAAAKPETEED